METNFFSFYLQNMTGMKDMNADYEGCAAKKKKTHTQPLTSSLQRDLVNIIDT
jgi:hypothetical protein